MESQAINQDKPVLETPEGTVAPNLDSELDAALNKSFHAHETLKSEESKTPKNDTKPDPKSTSKEIKSSELETKKEQKPVEEDKTLPDPEQVNESPPGKVSNQTKDGWNALRSNYKKSHQLVQEKDQEISKLKASLAEKSVLTQKETEALKSQIQELSQYRAMIDIQADPEFISKYDQPIEGTINSIKEMLGGMNVSKEVIDQVDFSNTKLMDEIIGHVGEHRDKFVARKLQRKVEELVDFLDKRDETLSQQKKNYKEHLEARKKENFTKEAENDGRLLRHLENIAAGKDAEGNVRHDPIPFLNKITPKDNASQAEVDQANNHNRMVDLMHKKVETVIRANSPEERAEMAIAAVAAHYFNAQLKAAATKIKSLEEELKKISTVTSETEHPKPVTRRNGKEIDLDEALSTHFSGNR